MTILEIHLDVLLILGSSCYDIVLIATAYLSDSMSPLVNPTCFSTFQKCVMPIISFFHFSIAFMPIQFRMLIIQAVLNSPSSCISRIIQILIIQAYVDYTE